MEVMESEKTLLTYDQVDRDQLTPMMQQVYDEKKAHPECVIFFRLGDFFELFFDDAITVSKALGLTLTRRECGLSEKAPMCGVPHLSADSYIARLIQRGFKIAVCEQVEDPALAEGLVKRQIVRIVTPGTTMDSNSIEALEPHYIASIYRQDDYFGLAFADLSTSSFFCTQILQPNADELLLSELARISPAEIICNQAFLSSPAASYCKKNTATTLSLQADISFSNETIARFSCISDSKGDTLWGRALASLLNYIETSAFQLPSPMPVLKPYSLANHLILNQSTQHHLELTRTLRSGERRGSLIWAIDRCRTAMGSRLLKEWLLAPLMSLEEIEKRQGGIRIFKEAFLIRNDLRLMLENLYDLERLTGKLSMLSANPRDLSAIKDCLAQLPALIDRLRSIQQPGELLHDILNTLDPLESLFKQLEATLNEELPAQVREGNIFKPGAFPELDLLREASSKGKDWLLEYEQQERQRTGIKNLKLKYSKVFGYAIEVTNSFTQLVPADYIRKQTLVNAERFITQELKSMEERILGSEEKALRLEAELFNQLRFQVAEFIPALRQNARCLALLDVLTACAELAETENYCCPKVVSQPVLEIVGGRHPVVEQMLRKKEFVPNDLILDSEGRRLMILTGPNMAGKSTYMRQSALIVLLAQAGLYVPAERAKIGIVDRICTRVGASDDLGSGQSTFMIEMSEVANILLEATPRSFLILDEIGRGTSTWDGMSMAWAIIEAVANPAQIGCRCLFATHYHELTELEGTIPGVFNEQVTGSRKGGQVVFLHQVKEGSCDSSFGIDVARLAGVPESVTLRAQSILRMLEKENHGQRIKIKTVSQPMEGQIDVFTAAKDWRQNEELISSLLSLDLNQLRPIDAFAQLERFQKIAMSLEEQKND